MRRFYVVESGTYIKKSGKSLLVCRGREVIEEIPLEQLQQLTLVGRASFSSEVLNELVKRRIETVLLSQEGRFRARLVVDEHGHVERRLNQYLKLSTPDVSLNVARKLVRAKLRSMARFTTRMGKHRNGDVLRSVGVQLQALAELAGRAESMDVVRGIEGKGSAVYFSTFGHFIKNKNFFFEKRTRRPPLDPVNALLSFVYTLLTNEVLTAIQIAGLDPYFGTLHETEYGRPSLACDLVEEWRVFLGDRFVLRLINSGVIKPDDFVFRQSASADGVDEEDLKRNRPVEMKPSAMKTLINSYEVWMEKRVKRCFLTGESKSFRGLIRDQARRFLAFIMGESESYQAYPWWRH